MKYGVVIEDYQDLYTHMNLITDFTGSFAKMFSAISYGIWLFLRWRIGGCGHSSLIWDTRIRYRSAANIFR